MEVKPIKIAILAMGGEGGGVLADWIVALGSVLTPQRDRCRSSHGAAVPTLAFALVRFWHAEISPESKRLARVASSLAHLADRGTVMP